MTFSEEFLTEVAEIVNRLDIEILERAISQLTLVRARGGRLFILGVGGSAANASHAVNDFRKLCGFECYSPTDNVSELTARVNDEGWSGVFSEWLKVSRLRSEDGILILSVGGGDVEKNVSANLVDAIRYAKKCGSSVIGIVGRENGYTARHADVAVIIPTVNPLHITPHSEAFQTIVWHLFVSHPRLKVSETKWESTEKRAKSATVGQLESPLHS